MLAGDVYPEDSGPNAKVQGRIQDERLAVDAGGHGLVRIDLEGRGGPCAQRALRTAVLAAPGGRTNHNDPEQAIVDARACAGADRVAEPVLVVGDQHHSAGVMFVSARPGPAHIDVAAAGAHHVRHGVQHGADLGVAVAGALDRLGVEAERDVVDEYATVDLGEVHPTLTAINERIERTDDVVAVNAEIEREVVAGAGGHAGVGQPALGGDLGNDRLRAVPTSHREPVRATLDRAAYEHLKVIAGLQLDRLDPTFPSLLGELEAFRLPATGARIEEKHRLSRRRGARQIHVDGKGGTRCCQ